MSDFRLTQINNVMLGTTDLPRSLAFYRDTLGLAVQFEMPRFVFLNAGGTEIVFGVADVTAAHEALRARGVEFLNAPRNVTGDQWAANFLDPDGHLLSVFGPEKA